MKISVMDSFASVAGRYDLKCKCRLKNDLNETE